MDNKFYYKTPAVMLMMLAGTTTIANAAENEVKPHTVEKTSNDTTTTSSTKTTTTTKAQPVNVVATKDLSQTKSISEQYSLTQAKTSTNTAVKTATTTTAVKPATTTTTAEKSVTAPNTLSAKRLTLNPTKVRTLGTLSTSRNYSTMSVNQMIKYNNWAVPEYEKSFFDSPKIAYRNGVGKPEGIVAHETANPNSTIDGEISYMKNNYHNAFVHAFIDDKRIVETADTDYISWGAGAQANPRFINVELVRVYGKEAFSRSINNYADYFATNLLYYGLPLDNADYDGQGTVWNHKGVSNFLGGTDHTDPIGWFQQNNYSFDEFYSLVSEKYNQKLNAYAQPAPTKPVATPPVQQAPVKPTVTPKPTTGEVATTTERRIARVKSENANIYTAVTNAPTSKAGAKANTSYYVNKKAVFNGETYYALTDQNKIPRGWVKANDTASFSITPEAKVSKNFTLKNTAKNLYATPWGTSKQTVANLSGLSGKQFKASKTVKVGKTPYYFGTVNNLTGWINNAYLSNIVPVQPKPAVAPVVTSSTKRVGKIKYKSAPIYSAVTDSKTKKALSKANKTYYINKQAKFNGEIFYALTDNKNTPRGWVKAKHARSYTITPEQKVNKRFIVKSNATNAYTMPYGTTKQIAGKLTPYVGKEFKATKFVKVGKNPYYFGTVDALTGWINFNQLATPSLKAPVKITAMKNVKLIGRTDAKNAVLYPNIQSTKVAKTKPVNMQVYINHEAKRNNVKYYGVSDPENKFLGWINDTFVKEKSFETVSWTKASYKIKKPTGYIYSIPGGSWSQRVKKLNTLSDNSVQVIRTDKVGTKLWHKVLLADNSVGYVPDSHLFTQNIKKIKAPESLAVAVAKQSRLKNPARNDGPKIVYSTATSAYNERFATDKEIRDNLNTKDKMKDPELKYQFLDLGQSEGISAKHLNKLLVGKGVLENQGAAFAAAAKQFKINEVYLIAHAILETGHGTSRLSNGLGITNDNTRILENSKKKYYNMYGTKAIDNNVELGGIAYAKQNGWDSASKAIIGGAKYVRQNYIDAGQRTLHQMRWNPENSTTHQYATDVRWATTNARIIARLYQQMGIDGLNYIVHEYI
ncbi:N-acetylmuramoyl-L-alanine amidase [Macrococcoides caseolyticum]|uniref:N-acetylmuramoyl-L-alanine amidase n=1 Tax=Macrococcoides caseolyticum TaxID=69966 RepID=UPI001F1DA304|nr:N-acetylmuramoyl-L-alanine amidase [Macrococcus caseolyticus]MCE4955692.1 glucosaminidase domain-containing protein [Macrococcus caseolyticus]